METSEELHRRRQLEGHYPCAVVVTPYEATKIIGLIEAALGVPDPVKYAAAGVNGLLVELTRVVDRHKQLIEQYDARTRK